MDQVDVLETMTPLQFLDFRNLLGTASGFQSYQFRLLENKLGFRPQDRPVYGNKAYYEEFEGEKRDALLRAEQAPSMVDLLGTWLERTPFLTFQGFDFIDHYRKAVTLMYDRDEAETKVDANLSEDFRNRRIAMINANREGSFAFLDAKLHEELYASGSKRLSFKATCAALFINLYRDEPILHGPFQLLVSLTEIDENFTRWRSRHALMVHRMLGEKMGTGQSSGYTYLMKTVEKARIFKDLFDLSTFLIPRSALPELPTDIKQTLGFYYSAA
jgi:tryptophan 2,3-dioxygenase